MTGLRVHTNARPDPSEDLVEIERGLERIWNRTVTVNTDREDVLRALRLLQNNFRTAFEGLRAITEVPDATPHWLREKAASTIRELSVAFCAARAEEENQKAEGTP